MLCVIWNVFKFNKTWIWHNLRQTFVRICHYGYLKNHTKIGQTADKTGQTVDPPSYTTNSSKIPAYTHRNETFFVAELPDERRTETVLFCEPLDLFEMNYISS